MLYKALLNSSMQAKFLFCAAYSTNTFPLYPSKYELELQNISSYLTLPTSMLGSPTFERQLCSLSFFLSVTWTQGADLTPGPQPHVISQTQLHVGQWGCTAFGDKFHVAAFSPTNTKVPHSYTDARCHSLSHSVTCCNKCVPITWPCWALLRCSVRKAGYPENDFCLIIHCFTQYALHISVFYHLFCPCLEQLAEQQYPQRKQDARSCSS